MLKAIMDSVMVFLSTVGDNGMLWIGIMLILLTRKSWRQAGVFMLLSIIAAGIAQDVLKDLFERPRPVMDPALLLVEMPSSYSFPSGHTLVAFCSAATLSVFMPRFGVIALAVAVLIGISRVYLGVHYISDVIFGAIFGMAISYLVLRFRGSGRFWRRRLDV